MKQQAGIGGDSQVASGIKYVGVVEDVKDEYRTGGVRVRILNVHGDKESGLATEDIPMMQGPKPPNGRVFQIPNVGQTVNVTFDPDNPYTGYYENAEHYNQNLQRKLESLSEEAYERFTAVHYDENLIFTADPSDGGEGMALDYRNTGLYIDNSSNMGFHLAGNSNTMYLGTNDSDQSAVLGDKFFEWMDKFMREICGSPYIGNLGVPVVPNGGLSQVCEEYSRIRPDFVSEHVKIVDNGKVNTMDRETWESCGDSWQSSVLSNDCTPNQTSDGSGSTSGGAANTSDGSPANNSYSGGGGDCGGSGGGSGGTGDGSGADIGTAEAPTDISPAECNQINERLSNLGFSLDETVNKITFIGIRSQEKSAVNKFVDKLIAFWVDDNGECQKKEYNAFSTVPGTNKSILATDVSLLLTEQESSYYLGTRTSGKDHFNINKNLYLDGNNNRSKSQAAIIGNRNPNFDPNQLPKAACPGCFFHKGFPGGVTVDDWSHGCQVFGNENEFRDWEDLLRWQKGLGYTNWKYILVGASKWN